MCRIGEDEPRTHYHFSISLRVRHPNIDPEQVTESLGIDPRRSWKAKEPRQAPTGAPQDGFNNDTYWTAEIAHGRWPLNLNKAIYDVLKNLVRHRYFLHRLRLEGGAVELLVGWFFENQSGDVLTHQCLALAGDLQVDLSLDVYSPRQPQYERKFRGSTLLQ